MFQPQPSLKRSALDPVPGSSILVSPTTQKPYAPKPYLRMEMVQIHWRLFIALVRYSGASCLHTYSYSGRLRDANKWYFGN